MIVISQAAPLLSLAAISHLELLHKLYGYVLVPPAVSLQIVWAGGEEEGSPGEILDLAWIETRQPSNEPLAIALGAYLPDEEAEALALAVDLNADWLLLDDPRARALARRFKLPFLGLLGVLVAARRAGHVGALAPLLDDLRAGADRPGGGLAIDDALYRRVLAAVDEAPSGAPDGGAEGHGRP